MDSYKSLLNLGCGNRLVTSTLDVMVINHDRRRHRPDVDVVWDLDLLPWPWMDDQFDTVIAWSVLEHLQINLVQSLDELWRIIKPGGQLQAKLPMWDHIDAHHDPTHRWWVTEKTWEWFDPDKDPAGVCRVYTDRHWILGDQALVADGASLVCWMTPRKSCPQDRLSGSETGTGVASNV